MLRPPPRPTLFPYTTLFRSGPGAPALFGGSDGELVLPADQRHPEQERLLRSEEHTSELQSQSNIVCRLLLEKKNNDSRLVISDSRSVRYSQWRCRKPSPRVS